MSECYSIDAVLDARGLICPEPVMLLHQAIRQMQVGQCVQVLATDPSTKRDISNFCNFLAHELVEQSEFEQEYHFVIRKA